MPKPAAPKKMAPCALCSKLVEKADAFCSGCNHAVCEGCDRTQPMGKHALIDHQLDH